jgi:diaminopimelate epimerase
MCGNAARCVALIYQKLAEGHPSRCRFLSLSGPIETQILSAHQVRVVMPTLAQEKDLIIKNSHGVSVPGFYVNTGVPHFVLEQIPDFELAKELRSHESFGPKGTNVTFVEVGSPRKAVTFERGVEDFTQACGTGAVAAARYIYKKAPQQKTVQVQMPGGILSVEFFGPESTQVYLQGQAQIEFKIIVP